MSLYGPPVLFALFVWWFSTGAIFFLDSRPRWTFGWSFAAVTLIAVAAVAGILRTSPDGSTTAAYADFTYGLVLWGWLETGFYMGFMLGPRRSAPEHIASGWRRFREAVETTLYHELAAGAVAMLIAAICWDMPNKLALWTFLILWVMQGSAKLNVFLGVPNLAEEFLPEHLAFLGRYMTRRPMNPFLPFSIAAGAAAAGALVMAAAWATGVYAVAALTMLATLTALAVLEHALLALPLRLDRLWRWALPHPEARLSRVGAVSAKSYTEPKFSSSCREGSAPA
jgi:putative photosynthetic complex assembly protein 2